MYLEGRVTEWERCDTPCAGYLSKRPKWLRLGLDSPPASPMWVAEVVHLGHLLLPSQVQYQGAGMAVE